MYMVVITAFALVLPVAAVLLYRQGLRDGSRMGAGELPPLVRREDPVELSPELEQLNEILANVERYDGSGSGQREV